MSIAREMKRGLRTLERALDNPTFTWKGNDYVCVPGSTKSAKMLRRGGGFSLEHDMVLRVRVAVFATVRPKPKQEVIYSGITYRIDQIDTPPGAAFIELRLIDPSKGV